MNGKKYSTLPKHQAGRYSGPITLILIIVIIGFFSGVVLSAASLYQPDTIRTSYFSVIRSDPSVLSDAEYIEREIRQEAIISYYTEIVGCKEIVTSVLAAAREYNIYNIDILFALMWKESQFSSTAINRNSGSIDRGLFQLNSTAYAKYPEEQFFNIEWNIRTGVRHYATELAAANGDYLTALYAYNAGRSRRENPPPRTIAYATDILQTAERYASEKDEYIQHVLNNKLSVVVRKGAL